MIRLGESPAEPGPRGDCTPKVPSASGRGICGGARRRQRQPRTAPSRPCLRGPAAAAPSVAGRHPGRERCPTPAPHPLPFRLFQIGLGAKAGPRLRPRFFTCFRHISVEPSDLWKERAVLPNPSPAAGGWGGVGGGRGSGCGGRAAEACPAPRAKPSQGGSSTGSGQGAAGVCPAGSRGPGGCKRVSRASAVAPAPCRGGSGRSGRINGGRFEVPVS